MNFFKDLVEVCKQGNICDPFDYEIWEAVLGICEIFGNKEAIKAARRCYLAGYHYCDGFENADAREYWKENFIEEYEEFERIIDGLKED